MYGKAKKAEVYPTALVRAILEGFTLELKDRGEWQEGDMQALEDLLQEDFEEYPEMYDALLKDRNLNWIKQLQPMLNDSDVYLVIVGAAHMLGEDGMVKLLEKQGYSVEQL